MPCSMYNTHLFIWSTLQQMLKGCVNIFGKALSKNILVCTKLVSRLAYN